MKLSSYIQQVRLSIPPRQMPGVLLRIPSKVLLKYFECISYILFFLMRAPGTSIFEGDSISVARTLFYATLNAVSSLGRERDPLSIPHSILFVPHIP